MIKLLKVIPLIAVGLAKKVDGKKTYIGLATTAVGIGMLFVPVLDIAAVETIITGLTITFGGATHKVVKAAKAKHNDNGGNNE